MGSRIIEGDNLGHFQFLTYTEVQTRISNLGAGLIGLEHLNPNPRIQIRNPKTKTKNPRNLNPRNQNKESKHPSVSSNHLVKVAPG